MSQGLEPPPPGNDQRSPLRPLWDDRYNDSAPPNIEILKY